MLWPGGAAHIAKSRNLYMALLYLRWMGAHGLCGFALCLMRAADLSLFLRSLPLKPKRFG